MCLSASNLWIDYILSADFPYKIAGGSKIDIELKKMHKKLDKILEDKAFTIAKSVFGTINIERNINNFRRLSSSFPSRPGCGEIDLLVVDKKNRILYVLEAKNVNRRIQPYFIRMEYNKFFKGNKPYHLKLQNKENFIKSNLKLVLKHFKVENIDGWIVTKAFIVNNNYYSAHLTNKQVEFIMIDDFLTYLKQDSKKKF